LAANKIWTFTATQTDVAGNVSAVSAAQTVNYDTTIGTPVVTLTSGTEAPTFTVKGTGGEAGASLLVFEGVALLGQTTVGLDGSWSVNMSPSLGAGLHNLSAVQTDRAGNTSAVAAFTRTVDTALLSGAQLLAASDSGNAGDNITNISTPTLTGSNAGAYGSVQVWEGSTLLGAAQADASGVWRLGISTPWADGNHSVVVKTVNSSGLVLQTSSATTLVIDTQAGSLLSAPALQTSSDSGLSGTDAITNITAPAFSGTAQAGSKVELLSNGTVVATGYADASGAWTLNLSAVAAGTYSITARQTDDAGNVSALSAATQVTVDTSVGAPVLFALSGAQGIQPIVSGTAEAFASVTVSVAGVSSVSVTADGQGNWRAQLPLSPSTTTSYSFTVQQTDVAGNVSTVTSGTVNVNPAFTANATLPASLSAPTITAGQDTGLAGNAGSTSDKVSSVYKPLLSGSGAANGATVELWANGVKVASTTANSGAYSFTAGNYSLGLGEGMQVLTVRQVVGGVSSQDSAVVSWTVDTRAGSSAASFQLASQFSSNANGLLFANTATPTLGGTTEAFAQVKVYDNGSLLQTVTANAAGVWTLSPVLSGSSHSITTIVTDVAGNTSSRSPALSFTVLTATVAAPFASLVAGGDSGVSSSDGITNLNSQWLKGTVTLTAGQDAPVVNVYDNGVLLGSVQADSTGAWSYNATGLAQGGHVLSVRAKDAAGNLSAATSVASLTVDSITPVALLLPGLANGEDTGTSASDGLTKNTQAVLSGTAEAGATVELYDAGVLVGSAQADASTGTFNVSPSLALLQGSHALTLVQVDAAGNRSAASAVKTITVDSLISGVTNLRVNSAQVLYTSAAETVTTIARPTLQGYAEAGATVEVFNGVVSLGTAIAGIDGAWSLTPNANLAASNSLTAKQTDGAGNVSASSAALSVVYNASASVPSVKLQTDSDTGTLGDGITANTTPTLVANGSVVGVSSGDTIELWSGATQLGTTVAGSGGAWAVRPSLALADNSYTFTVKNATTNTTLGSLKLVVDATKDTPLTGLSLSLDSDTGILNDGLTKWANPRIQGAGATPGATVQLLEGSTLVGLGLADGAGNWQVQTVSLGDGTHSLTAVQVDAAGNSSAASSPLTVKVDTLVASLATPLLVSADDTAVAGDGITHKTSLNVSGQGAEARAWVTVFNGSVQVARVQAATDGSWTAQLTNLTSGNYSLTARQTDLAGNLSAASAALALRVDVAAAAPGFALDASSKSSLTQPGYTMQTLPTFSGVAEAGATVSVYDGSILLGTALAHASTGAWSLTSSVALSLGTHGNVYAKQTDVAGNLSPATASLAVTVLPNVVTQRTFALPGHWTYSLSAGDVNGDGALDLYAAVFVTSNRLMLGNGAGGFTDTAINIPFAPNSLYNATASLLTDFNGDGRPDVINLVTTQNAGINASFSNGFWVNRGGATGFANVATAADGYTLMVGNGGPGIGYQSIGSMGDLNGDGYMDFSYSYSDSARNNIQTTFMLSTAPGVWRAVRNTDSGPLSAPNLNVLWVDFNQDGRLDVLANSSTTNTGSVWLATAGGGYTLTQMLGRMATLDDLNGDGYVDALGSNNAVAWGRGDGSFVAGTQLVTGGGVTGTSKTALVDVNADGRLDMVYVDTSGRVVVGINNGDGSYTNQATAMGWEASGNGTNNSGSIRGNTTQMLLVDANGDRSLDLVIMGSQGSGVDSNVLLNLTSVAENTFLRVMVANDHGGLDAYGAVVRLYDHDSGSLVAMAQASKTVGSFVNNVSQHTAYGADFFGLDPAKTYDIAVVYPGSDASVTVVTGKAGLGLGNIASGSLNQIVDSSLTAVSPGGKDVVWVAKENRSTSATGGYWLGSNLADQMVGDTGADVFTPNGARIGEAGDTLTGGGGRDTFVFNQLANLNTVATITDFTATAGTNADAIDLGALLTKLGYTGTRDASGVASWVQLTDSGSHTTLQMDAHTGSGGASSGFVDVVKLNGVTGLTLANLVSGGFVHLGGVNVSGIAVDQTVTEAQARTGVQLAASAALSAEGGQWAAGLSGAILTVKLDYATSEDTLGFGTQGGVSYNADTRALSINGTQVATVHSAHNGVGSVGQLDMTFDFSAAGAGFDSSAQQAAAVQTVMQSLKLTNNTYAPLALNRGITFDLTDALGMHTQMLSGLRITPQADSATLGGVNYITGTESVEALTGTSANETFVGYNGVPTVANTARLGTVTTWGDTLTGGGGIDTFQWLSKQTMNSDASDNIADFGFAQGTGTGQGAGEADKLDLSQLLEGFNGSSVLSDYVKAVNEAGKLQVQVDYNGKANGFGFEKTWFVGLDNVSIDSSNNVLVNGATMSATAAGLSGNVTLDNVLQQMMADSQFKLL
jgi:hypothetical protein